MAELPVQQISPQDLKDLARVARLGLSDGDLERLHPQVARYLGALRRLHQVDLGDTEPMTIFVGSGVKGQGTRI